jgi:hypothetical protein
MKKNGYDSDECCYAEMANDGKNGGQSITKVDNSIHSEYWNEPMQNSYEMKRNSQFDQSGMKGK